MLIFLYGPDTYGSKQKLNELIDHYQKINPSGLNLRFFDLEEKTFNDFQQEFQTQSMFKEKKLLVMKNASLNKDFQDDFLKNDKKFIDSKDIIIFYEKGELKGNNIFLKFLKKQGKSQNFELLVGEKLKNWAKKELARYKSGITPLALDSLLDFVGNNLWQMSNEIRKLVNYKSGGEITPEDVELLVGRKIETEIFKTIDFLVSKNKKEALRLIHEHLKKGDPPLYLLTMINFQFRNLLVIKELIDKGCPYFAIQNKTKLHPFVVRKTYSQAQKFSLEELKKIYQKIFQADLAIKTGKIEPGTALDLFITEI